MKIEDSNQICGFTSVNGARLYFEMSGTGKSVVLIHGGLVNCHLWDGQFPKFAQYFQTVRYDLRGFGQSEFPNVPYSHTEDPRALLQFLGIQRTVIIGLSLGGTIATNFAIAYPKLVESLVLVGAGLDGYQVTQEKYFDVIQQFLADVRGARTRGSGAGIGVNLARLDGWPQPFPRASKLSGPRACPQDERGKLAPAETGGEREITGRTACSGTTGRNPCADAGGSGSRRHRAHPGDRLGIGPEDPRSRQSVDPGSRPPFALGETGRVQPDRTEFPCARMGSLGFRQFLLKIPRTDLRIGKLPFLGSVSPDLS